MRTGPGSLAQTVGGCWLAILLLTVSGCGEGERSSPRLAPNGPNARITQADLDVLFSSASPFVLALIEDGEVTAAEYEAAAFRTMQCFDENDVEHSELRYQKARFGKGSWRYQYVANPATEPSRAQCEVDYFRSVDTVWQKQFVLTQDQNDQLDEEFVSCANDAGIDGDSRQEVEQQQSSPDLSPDQQHAVLRCLILAYEGQDIDQTGGTAR